MQCTFLVTTFLLTTRSTCNIDGCIFLVIKALRQFHAIALGLDVLGNPYGLLTDISEGVKDFFYEPYQVLKSLFTYCFRNSTSLPLKISILLVIIGYRLGSTRVCHWSC